MGRANAANLGTGPDDHAAESADAAGPDTARSSEPVPGEAERPTGTITPLRDADAVASVDSFDFVDSVVEVAASRAHLELPDGLPAVVPLVPVDAAPRVEPVPAVDRSADAPMSAAPRTPPVRRRRRREARPTPTPGGATTTFDFSAPPSSGRVRRRDDWIRLYRRLRNRWDEWRVRTVRRRMRRRHDRLLRRVGANRSSQE